MSPIRRCSLKGKSIATVSDSTDYDGSDSPLIGRPRVIMLGGMYLIPPTGDGLAELNDKERSVVHFIIELEDREASGHTPLDEAPHETDNTLPTNRDEDIDAVGKEKNPTEKEIDFSLADLLHMRWTGTNFEFDDEIDPERERHLSVKKNQRWENHFPTRPWTPPLGYACVYESWFNNCQLWWLLPEFLTTYCSRRKIALGQYTANGIRIMVTLTVLASEMGIKMSVRLFEELTTPSITAKTGFFFVKMVPKYNIITGKPAKVNLWNRSYFYVKINEEDPSVIQNGYFNANIGMIVLKSGLKAAPTPSLNKLKRPRTLSHQNWPDISEARVQAALNRIIRAEDVIETPSSRSRNQRMGKLNLTSIPSYADSIGTPSHDQEESPGGSRPAKRRRATHPSEGTLNVSASRSSSPIVLEEEHPYDEVRDDKVRTQETPERNTSPKNVDEMGTMTSTEGPAGEHPADPLMEIELPDAETQKEDIPELDPASHNDEVVRYPHLIDFRYQHTTVPFVEDHEAPTRLFRQIKLKKKGIPELDELSQNSRYREMTRADYEVRVKAQDEKLAEKTRSLKRKRKEIAELAFKCSSYEDQVGNLVAEKKLWKRLRLKDPAGNFFPRSWRR
ncbi:hypothetical protein N665_0194s0029 [Sinapis alba]|nr:hypothetical protein N665_0194s0029 [Sinapis alba]